MKSARFALKSCIIFSSPAMLMLMFAADEITEIYFAPTADAWLVDGMPLFENVTMALLSAAAMPLIGSDAVWLSFPATELICLAIIAAAVFKRAGKVTFKLDDWLKVDADFGKVPTLERAFNSMEDVVEVSADVVKFCKSNRVEENLATMAGVVTEELSDNVLLHGVESSEHCSSYVRVTFKDDLHIRIYDDNREFNPRKAMQKIETEPAPPGEEKIGLRLVKSITARYGAFDYQNTAGINTSIVELRC